MGLLLEERISRHKTTHEEADAIIVTQAIYAAKEENKHVVVVADDTDVDILLLYHYQADAIIVAQAIYVAKEENKHVVVVADDTDVDILLLYHHQADAIIVARAIYAAKEENKHVVVVADDTDVDILLLYHYQAESLNTPMKLKSTQAGRAFIDVTATVRKLRDLIAELLPAHALSGCDTVPMCHGI